MHQENTFPVPIQVAPAEMIRKNAETGDSKLAAENAT